MRSYKIYIITNSENHKVYIGQTINSLKRRFNDHCNNNSSIGKAIKSIGKDKFKIMLLNDSATTPEESAILETKYIEKYNSINNGYNSIKGIKSCANLDKPLKPTIAITLDEEVLNKLKDYAEKEDRNISSQINKILKDFFKKD